MIKLDKGIASATVRKLFGRWYATDLWPAITPEQLATFVERYGVYPPK